MSPSVPSLRTKTFPGCGSAWKKPNRSTWSSIERSSCSASAPAVELATSPSCSASARVEAVEPLLDEQPAGAELAVDLRDADVARRTEQHRHLLHRRRPRAGSRARRAGSARTGRAPHPSERPGRSWCAAARRRRAATSAARSRSITSSMSGPLDLHDDRLARLQAGRRRSDRSTRRRAAPSRTRRRPCSTAAPSSASRTGRIRSAGSGADPVLQQRELVAHLRREEIDSRRRDLTELDVDAAGRSSRTRRRRTPSDLSIRSARRVRADEADRSPRAERGATSSRYRRMTLDAPARSRAGVEAPTTRPARSPIASEPGRASRSSVTATAIVAGIPIASDVHTRPSAPQSQSDEAQRQERRGAPADRPGDQRGAPIPAACRAGGATRMWSPRRAPPRRRRGTRPRGTTPPGSRATRTRRAPMRRKATSPCVHRPQSTRADRGWNANA